VIQRVVHGGDCFALIDRPHPAANRPCSQANHRDWRTVPTELSLLHVSAL
jgi:hypothetical protein